METMIRYDDPVNDPAVHERREKFATEHRTDTDEEILIGERYYFPDGATMEKNPWGRMVTVEDRRRSRPPGSPSGSMDPNAAWENANIIRLYWEEKAANATQAYNKYYGNLSHYVSANQAGMIEATSAPPESELDDLRKLKKKRNSCLYHWRKAKESLEEAVPEWKRRKARKQERNIKANREFEEKLREVDEHIEEYKEQGIKEQGIKEPLIKEQGIKEPPIKEQAIKEPPIKEQAIKEQGIKEPDDGKDNFWEDDVEQEEPAPLKKKESVKKHKTKVK